MSEEIKYQMSFTQAELETIRDLAQWVQSEVPAKFPIVQKAIKIEERMDEAIVDAVEADYRRP